MRLFYRAPCGNILKPQASPTWFWSVRTERWLFTHQCLPLSSPKLDFMDHLMVNKKGQGVWFCQALGIQHVSKATLFFLTILIINANVGRLAEVREALQLLYFTNDSSNFELLLGFTKEKTRSEVVQMAKETVLDVDQVFGNDVEEESNNLTFEHGEAQADSFEVNVDDKSKWQMDRNEFKEEINEKEDSPSKCFQCSLCENNYEDRRAFMQHMINVHNEKEEHNTTPASKFKEKKR